MKKRDINYHLAYGPDLTFDGRGLPITPKPDVFAMPLSRRKRTKKIKKPSEQKLPKTEDLYTLALVFGTLTFIAWFLMVRKENPDVFKTEPFDPDIVPDYASFSSGASIEAVLEGNTYRRDYVTLKIFPWKLFLPSDKSTDIMLKPWKSPGECWAFEGHQAKVRIRLSHHIVPRAVTLEHISKKISPTGNIDSAPREFTITEVDGEETNYLGSFEYADNGKSVQSFVFPVKVRYPVRTLDFQILNNHGHPLYTCVYKLRVHGDIFH